MGTKIGAQMNPAKEGDQWVSHGATTMSEVLRVVAGELEALTQYRDYLAHLIRCGEARPAYQPEYPELACDRQLLGRLDKCQIRLGSEQKHLEERRTALLREARANSPFSCPPDLLERITNFETLQAHANNRSVKGLLSFSKQCQEGRLVIEHLKPYIQGLADIDQCGLETAAQAYANERAYPCTPFWDSKRDEYKSRHPGWWKVVSDHIQAELQRVYAERRRMKARHDEDLEREIEALLALPSAVLEARGLIAEVSVTRERDAAAREAVRQVWRETQEVRRWAYRNPIELGENDRTLATNWASSHDGGSYWIGAMESARCAELVALDLYRKLFGRAEDLSILQILSPSDSRWQTADIAIGRRCVDVKNARRSFSSRNSYSEHCVKSFKSGPSNHQIVVSGFLSEYLADGRMGAGEQVVWLGETTLETIDGLRRQFETEFLRLDFSGGLNSRIPPWLFEYPTKCYAQRNAALATVRSPSFVLPRSDCPLGFLVLAGRVKPSFSEDPLAQEIVALTRRIGTVATLTRPVLFLHVLDRFCRTAHDGVPFPSKTLRQILFSGDSAALAEYSDGTTPLAVFDPLETVKELLNVLERVAECCVQRAVTFTSFRLAGPGVFQGRRTTGNWQTIFAYCGGWGKLSNGGSVKCGRIPLFIGQNDPCDACGKLVCDRCGFCSTSCPSCSQRQADWPTLSSPGRRASPEQEGESDTF